MKELWKDIPGYEGLYQASTEGRIKSLPKLKGFVMTKEKIMKPQTDRYGYLRVMLSDNNKRKFCQIHRLVALAWIPNPNNLPCVNHKDENPKMNTVSNLEWCDVVYNNNYGKHNQKVSGSKINGERSKPVKQFSIDGLFIKSYPSAREIERQTGYSQANISNVCTGKYKQAYGFIWKYA